MSAQVKDCILAGITQSSSKFSKFWLSAVKIDWVNSFWFLSVSLTGLPGTCFSNFLCLVTFFLGVVCFGLVGTLDWDKPL